MRRRRWLAVRARVRGFLLDGVRWKVEVEFVVQKRREAVLEIEGLRRGVEGIDLDGKNAEVRGKSQAPLQRVHQEDLAQAPALTALIDREPAEQDDRHRVPGQFPRRLLWDGCERNR